MSLASCEEIDRRSEIATWRPLVVQFWSRVVASSLGDFSLSILFLRLPSTKLLGFTEEFETAPFCVAPYDMDLRRLKSERTAMEPKASACELVLFPILMRLFFLFFQI